MMVRYDLLRSAAHPREVAEGFGRSILLPTDFSASSMRALMAVFEMPAEVCRNALSDARGRGEAFGDKARKAEEGAEFQLRNMVNMAAENGIIGSPGHQEGRREARDPAGGQRATRLRHGRRFARSQSAARGHARQCSLTLMRQASCPVIIVP